MPQALIDRLLAHLTSDTLADATRIAALVLEVRGYGHIKERAAADYEPQLASAIAPYEATPEANQVAIGLLSEGR